MNIVDILLDPFAYAFMTRALWATLIASVVCALLSCWLVLIGWSLMGDAVSHAVLPGVVLAHPHDLLTRERQGAVELLRVPLAGGEPEAVVDGPFTTRGIGVGGGVDGLAFDTRKIQQPNKCGQWTVQLMRRIVDELQLLRS